MLNTWNNLFFKRQCTLNIWLFQIFFFKFAPSIINYKNYKNIIMIHVRLSSLSVNDSFRFVDYREKPSGPVYRVVGYEYNCVTFVNLLDLFSPVYYAIDYAFVQPIKI